MLRILALFAVVGITLFIYSIRNRVEEFQRVRLSGHLFDRAACQCNDIAPRARSGSDLCNGSHLPNPFGVGLAAGLGGTIGELSGYLAGFSGQAVVERMDIYNRVKPWVDKYGGWAILVLSAIPNPFFDIAGMAAGIAKMPLQTFLLFSGDRSTDQDDRLCPGRALLHIIAFNFLRIRRAK